MFKHILAYLEQLFFGARLILDHEVHSVMQIFRFLEVNDIVFALESGLEEIQILLNGLVNKSPIEIRMGRMNILLHDSSLKLNNIFITFISC